MAVFKWCKGEVPDGMKVKQVYGLIFSQDGKMLIAIDRGQNTLAGGKPEAQDVDMEAALKREVYEEVNITVGKAYIVGYQLVDEEDGEPPYAQVRMVAMVDSVDPITPDPATGRLFERIFVEPSKAVNLLAWGDVGEQQINDAMVLATQKWGLFRSGKKNGDENNSV